MLVMITAQAALPTHLPAGLAEGWIWICKLGNPNLLMLTRYWTQAALLCAIDKVPGAGTHWLRSGDTVKTQPTGVTLRIRPRDFVSHTPPNCAMWHRTPPPTSAPLRGACKVGGQELSSCSICYYSPPGAQKPCVRPHCSGAGAGPRAPASGLSRRPLPGTSGLNHHSAGKAGARPGARLPNAPGPPSHTSPIPSRPSPSVGFGCGCFVHKP